MRGGAAAPLDRAGRVKCSSRAAAAIDRLSRSAAQARVRLRARPRDLSSRALRRHAHTRDARDKATSPAARCCTTACPCFRALQAYQPSPLAFSLAHPASAASVWPLPSFPQARRPVVSSSFPPRVLDGPSYDGRGAHRWNECATHTSNPPRPPARLARTSHLFPPSSCTLRTPWPRYIVPRGSAHWHRRVRYRSADCTGRARRQRSRCNHLGLLGRRCNPWPVQGQGRSGVACHPSCETLL